MPADAWDNARCAVTLEDWRRNALREKQFLIGAAIGSGLVAHAAARGGADFLLVLSAGLVRQRGRHSIGSMLPLGVGNADVLRVAERDIIGATPLPVFLGVNVMDRSVAIPDLLVRLREAGVAGVANFPTSQLLAPTIRSRTTALGLGFERECELLAEATRRGMLALAYVNGRSEARAMCKAGVPLICLNFGWNVGGAVGVDIGLTLEYACDLAARIGEDMRRNSPRALFLIEGGPIQDVLDIFRVASAGPVHGYVGGSTLDRLPLERAVAQQASAFKSARFLSAEARKATVTNHVFARTPGLVGTSENHRRVTVRLADIGALRRHVLIDAEPGLRAEDVAQSIIRISEARWAQSHYAELDPISAAARLFGSAAEAGNRRQVGLLEHASGAPVVVRLVGEPTPAFTRALARLVSYNRYSIVGSHETRATRSRLIVIREAMVPNPPLRQAFRDGVVELVPLRLRAEDVPDLVRQRLEWLDEIGTGRVELHPAALPSLISYHWPGNLDQLYEAVDHAATLAEEGTIGRLAAISALQRIQRSIPAAEVADERQMILNALNRNAFHRGRTAMELGISRRTLYTKLRSYGLSKL